MSFLCLRCETGHAPLSTQVGVGNGTPEQHVAPGLHVVEPHTSPLNDVSHWPVVGLQVTDGEAPLKPVSVVPSSAMGAVVGQPHFGKAAARSAAHVATVALLETFTPVACIEPQQLISKSMTVQSTVDAHFL